MDTTTLNVQVETIRQTFGYLNRFRGKTFVIKIDSSCIFSEYFPILIRDIVLLHEMDIKVIVVPGARIRIDEVLNTYDISCTTCNGTRISPPEAIPFIKMAAFDVSNKVMTQFAENNANAIIGNWVRARAIGVLDGVDYQSSGIVEKMKKEIINNVLDDGLIPIFPNIGWSGAGKPYNISSDDLAFSISKELKASKLFFLSETGGIPAKPFVVPDDVPVTEDGFISQLTVEKAGAFIDMNHTRAYNRHIDFISMGYRACSAGVDRVHIVDGTVKGMLLKEIFSNRGLGTMIYANEHENIRPMHYGDIPDVLNIMQSYINRGQLIPRTEEELKKGIGDFCVYEVDKTIHASGALHSLDEKTGEIAALAVDKTYASLGIGKKMVSYLIERGTVRGMNKIVVLTTQAFDWFYTLGFREGGTDDLPPDREQRYLSQQRNSRVLVYDVSDRRYARSLTVE